MAVYGDITFDSRVRREAAALAGEGYHVSLVCLEGADGPDLPAGVEVLRRRPSRSSVLPRSPRPSAGTRGGRVASLARDAMWFRGYIANLRSWGRLVTAACGDVDLWHLHDLPALAAVAPIVGGMAPIVYDSHELFLEAGTAGRLPGPVRSVLRRYERHLVAGVSATVTVNDALAEVLRRRYRPKRILVVHNCPDRWSPQGRTGGPLRGAAGIPDDARVILYHGGLGADRGVDQLMHALLQPGLEKAHLVLLGSGVKRDHYAALAGEPRWLGRVHVLDAVPPADLLSWVASADVGGVLIQRSTLNHYLSTPNKLFECLAAGVPVVASDFPEMRRIVAEDPAGPLGAVCDPADVADAAAAIRSVLELDDRASAALRDRCLAAAHDRWNWQAESANLVKLYRELLGEPKEPRRVDNARGLLESD
jgi:glycosyltransferase involved in cell wall biosynthesis